MKNKILVNIYIPALDEAYELYIPVNESVKKVLELISKLVEDYSDSDFDSNSPHILVDSDSCIAYKGVDIIRDTNIKNGKLLLLV